MSFDQKLCRSNVIEIYTYNCISDERVGNLTIVLNNPDPKPRIKSQLEKLARALWSNPPNHGARIVAMVLNNPALNEEW